MSLNCPICGREYLHDRKICQTCEETAIISGLNSQDGKITHKWRCDNFLELNNLVFGSNQGKKYEEKSFMVNCPDCGEEYSYGRKIWHTCGINSIPFGKIFEPEYKARKWNCDTAMACMELMATDLNSAESIAEEPLRFEKLETTDYKWNDLKLNIEIDVKKNHLIYE